MPVKLSETPAYYCWKDVEKFALEEGGVWIPATYKPATLHTFMTKDGSRWDCVTGWHDPFPQSAAVETPQQRGYSLALLRRDLVEAKVHGEKLVDETKVKLEHVNAALNELGVITYKLEEAARMLKPLADSPYAESANLRPGSVVYMGIPIETLQYIRKFVELYK